MTTLVAIGYPDDVTTRHHALQEALHGQDALHSQEARAGAGSVDVVGALS